MIKEVVNAFSLIEAKKIIYEKYKALALHDITRKWKLNNSPLQDPNITIIAIEEMKKYKMFSHPNVAVFIVRFKGVSSNLIRNCYNIINYPRVGRCKTLKRIELRSKFNNNILGQASNKKDALKKSKELVLQHRQSIYAKTIFESKDIDFEITFNSKTARLGEYIFFITEEKDVFSYKKETNNKKY